MAIVHDLISPAAGPTVSAAPGPSAGATTGSPPGPEDRRQWWTDWLGARRDPTGRWTIDERRRDAHGVRSYDLTLQSHGTQLRSRLLRPAGLGPCPVVVVPFYEVETLVGEPCQRTAHRHGPTQAYASVLATHGLAALAVPWWCEVERAESAGTDLESRYGPPARRHLRQHDVTALGRSVGDLLLAVDAVTAQNWVDSTAIGVLGHSLGGKLALHLAALDLRIAAGVAHEPGIGFDHSNWDAPWYLGSHRPADRDQDDLLGLVAPRPFLLAAGGDSDGAHNAPLVESARTCWGDSGHLQTLVHDTGHQLPAHVLAACATWLRTQLGAGRSARVTERDEAGEGRG